MSNITVIIPVFNTPPHHLIETVYSIINQKGGPYPIIIVDDGSTKQETFQLISYLTASLPIRVIGHDTNLGSPTAMNTGTAEATTDYITIHGSSDISAPGRLKMQLDYLKANPKVDVLGAGLFAFRDTDIHRKEWFKFVNKPTPTIKDRSDNPYHLVNHGTAVYKRSVVNEIGGYNPLFKRGQDIELWTRLHKAGKVFRNLPDVLYAWRR